MHNTRVIYYQNEYLGKPVACCHSRLLSTCICIGLFIIPYSYNLLGGLENISNYCQTSNHNITGKMSIRLVNCCPGKLTIQLNTPFCYVIKTCTQEGYTIKSPNIALIYSLSIIAIILRCNQPKWMP